MVGGNGDDDFGDFGQVQATGDDDFSGGNNTFQDTGDFGDFEGTTDSDAFGAPEPAPVEAQPQPPAQVEEAPPVEASSLRNRFSMHHHCSDTVKGEKEEQIV